MTSQRETDLRRGLVRELCTQSNRVFRLELCVKQYLEGKGFTKAQIREALDDTRLGELKQLTEMLGSTGEGYEPLQTQSDRSH